MTLQQECAKLKAWVLEGFNKQFSTNLTVTNTTMIVQRPVPGEVARFLLVTNRSDDNVRILVRLRGFGFFSDLERFELKLLPNYSAGNLRDEIQTTFARLSQFHYPKLKSHFGNPNFEEVVNTPPTVVDTQGNRVKTASGFYIRTQGL